MVRSSTHTNKFYLPDNIQLIDNVSMVEISYSQNGQVVLQKTDKDENVTYSNIDNIIIVKLTPKETRKFRQVGIPANVKDSKIMIQIKLVDANNETIISEPMYERLYDAIDDDALS